MTPTIALIIGATVMAVALIAAVLLTTEPVREELPLPEPPEPDPLALGEEDRQASQAWWERRVAGWARKHE